MSSPRISVLIPTYNYARFLPEAIESVLGQDYPDFELLISDDRSTDGSAEVIAAYAARDARIRFQVQPVNLGMVPHWNWCLQQARGEYIKFLFGDDRLASPQALRKLSGLLDAHPTASLAASARSVIRHDSTPAGLWDEFQQGGRHPGDAVILRCLHETRNLIGEPSVTLFRRAHAARGYDPRYRQIVDLEFWFHLLEQGDFAYTPEPLCAFRHHALQQSERHAIAEVGTWELFELFAEYRTRAARRGTAFPTRSFHRLYHHLRQHCQSKASVPPAMRALEQELATQISPWRYAAFRARRKVRDSARQLRGRLQRLLPRAGR